MKFFYRVVVVPLCELLFGTVLVLCVLLVAYRAATGDNLSPDSTSFPVLIVIAAAVFAIWLLERCLDVVWMRVGFFRSKKDRKKIIIKNNKFRTENNEKLDGSIKKLQKSFRLFWLISTLIGIIVISSGILYVKSEFYKFIWFSLVFNLILNISFIVYICCKNTDALSFISAFGEYSICFMALFAVAGVGGYFTFAGAFFNAYADYGLVTLLFVPCAAIMLFLPAHSLMGILSYALFGLGGAKK